MSSIKMMMKSNSSHKRTIQQNPRLLFHLIVIFTLIELSCTAPDSSQPTSSTHHQEHPLSKTIRDLQLWSNEYNESRQNRNLFNPSLKSSSSSSLKKAKSNRLQSKDKKKKKKAKRSRRSRRPRYFDLDNRLIFTTPNAEILVTESPEIERLLGKESEILVPLPLPPWERSPQPPPSSSQAPSTSSPSFNNYEESSINDITFENAKVIECSNDTLRQDLGIACLKRGLDLSSNTIEDNHINSIDYNNNRQTNHVTKPPGHHHNYHNNNHHHQNHHNHHHRTRYFTVKPMMNDYKKKHNPNFKTPAQTARQMYVDKSGYRKPAPKYPPKVVTQLSPGNHHHQHHQKHYPSQQNSIFQGRNPFITQSTYQAYFDPEIQEDLELLNSLKASLGVLGAQALNVKQRTHMLYREAKRRKLIFFDGLLHRTHSVITEKQEETKHAMEAIDGAINRIKRHQEMSNYLYKLKKNQHLSDRYPNGMRKYPKLPELNPKQLDRLLYDGLVHAKNMMKTVRQLNDALDEFEEQFNFPRFEPNSIDDYLKDAEL